MNQDDKPHTGEGKQITKARSGVNQRRERALLAGLIIIFILASSATIVLGFMVFKPQLIVLLNVAGGHPNISITPQCVRPTLAMGAYIYPLEEIAVKSNGTLPIIPGPPGTAWWASETTSPYVIIFDPASRSLDLKTVLSPGDRMDITWDDCSQLDFVFTDFQDGDADDQTLLAQSGPGITVYVLPVGTDHGYVLHGQLP